MENQTLAKDSSHGTLENNYRLSKGASDKGQAVNMVAKKIERFLQDLFGPNTQKGYLVLWTKQGSRSYFYSLDQLDEAASMAASLSEETDVYYGIGLRERFHKTVAEVKIP